MSAVDKRLNITIYLVNQNTIERVIPVEWELSTVVNYYKGERYFRKS